MGTTTRFRTAMYAAAAILLAFTCREPTAPTAPPVEDDPALGAGSPPGVTLDLGPGPVATLVGAGDIASCSNNNDELTARLLDTIPGTVMALGDNAYSSGSATEYATCYEPTWGRHKSRTRPTPGDKDYATAGVAGYWGYFGAAAGDSGAFYYTYELGAWQVIVLNTKLPTKATSPQVLWLREILAASTKSCQVAYWHVPYVSSTSTGVRAALLPVMDVLYEFGVEIVVAANEKLYERFAPMRPDLTADPVGGVRQFVVGTGGASKTAFGTIHPLSEARSTNVPGVLRLSLGTAGYEWRFIPIAGQTFTDEGSGTCNGSPDPVADAGGPYVADLTLTLDGSGSYDPQGNTPLSYDWDFGDGSPHGSGVAPTHTYATAGTYTVTLVVTDALGNPSAPATTTATVSALPPSADPGGPYAQDARTVLFDGSRSHDPQGNTPLSYDWDFGDGTPHGSGVAPTHAYAANGGYTVTLVVTDALGNPSAPATTTVTIANVAPAVSAGPDRAIMIGETVTLAASFADPGTDDGPWTYWVNWGDGSVPEQGTLAAPGPIAATHTYASTGTYTAAVTVTDAEGAPGTDDAQITVSPPGAEFTFIGAGDIASCNDDRDELTARILDATPGVVYTIGDNAYPNGRAIDYARCYEPTWGRHKERTWAVLGNHEYDTGSADASFDYFGERAGPRGKGYYSFDLGDWHIIVLNDNSSFVPFKAGSEQDLWLQNDLATNTKSCIMALWHQPLFMSSNSAFIERSSRRIFWERLYAAGADVVLAGHQHFYERMHPMRPDSTRDDATGIRAFIVGTGGESSALPVQDIHPNSVVRSAHFGVLKFTLRAGAYDWEFVPAQGWTFTDRGSATCH